MGYYKLFSSILVLIQMHLQQKKRDNLEEIQNIDNLPFSRNNFEWSISLIDFKKEIMNIIFKRFIFAYKMLKNHQQVRQNQDGNVFGFIIFECILDISFSHLKILNLSNNNIQSIQKLCYIDMPLLEKLSISDNWIRSLRGLERSHFPFLKGIWASNNCLIEIGLELSVFALLHELYTQRNMISCIKNLFKGIFEQLTWLSISTHPQSTSSTVVNSFFWQNRLKAKYQRLEKVWMPAFHSMKSTRQNIEIFDY